MTTGDRGNEHPSEAESDRELPADVPRWDDEYLMEVATSLMFNFDLEKGFRVDRESFDLYGELQVDSHKQFLTSALSYARQEERQHVFARRVSQATVGELERLVDLGHALADDWVEASEEHYGTEFVFVLVAPEVPEEVCEFVSTFKDRTLLKYGYYGEYRIHLVAVAPETETLVASPGAHVATAFRLWEPTSEEKSGLFDRLKRLF